MEKELWTADFSEEAIKKRNAKLLGIQAPQDFASIKAKCLKEIRSDLLEASSTKPLTKHYYAFPLKASKEVRLAVFREIAEKFPSAKYCPANELYLFRNGSIKFVF